MRTLVYKILKLSDKKRRFLLFLIDFLIIPFAFWLCFSTFAVGGLFKIDNSLLWIIKISPFIGSAIFVIISLYKS